MQYDTKGVHALGRSGNAASYSARVLGNKSTGWMFDQHDHHDYDHDDQLPWQDEEEELWWTLGNKATGWKFDDHFWSDDSDDEDDDASEVEDSYGVGDDDKRAKGEEKGMWLTIQGDDRNENSDDDDNAGEKANGEEKALIPKELNCQEAPRSNWAMSTILGRASASSSLFVN